MEAARETTTRTGPSSERVEARNRTAVVICFSKLLARRVVTDDYNVSTAKVRLIIYASVSEADCVRAAK